MNVYLDHAATAPLSFSMRQYISSVLEIWGNPSSAHSVGEAAAKLLEDARASVSAFIGTSPGRLFFTPSGSASNTLAVRGYCAAQDCRAFYSPVAHKSVLACCKSLADAEPMQTDSEGVIDLADLRRRVERSKKRPFIVAELANSEIGTIQDANGLARLAREYGGASYLDCTGGISSVPVNAPALDADMLGFSAHKLGALKGCGALYKKPEIRLSPLICGSQEQGLSAGTQNVIGIASFGKAAKDYDYAKNRSAGRDRVYRFIQEQIPDSYLVGAFPNRLPNHLSVCFRGAQAESLLMMLDQNGIQASAGPACQSKESSASAALSAIGIPKEDQACCIRFSFGGTETNKELDYVCETLRRCVYALRSLRFADSLH